MGNSSIIDGCLAVGAADPIQGQRLAAFLLNDRPPKSSLASYPRSATSLGRRMCLTLGTNLR